MKGDFSLSVGLSTKVQQHKVPAIIRLGKNQETLEEEELFKMEEIQDFQNENLVKEMVQKLILKQMTLMENLLFVLPLRTPTL